MMSVSKPKVAFSIKIPTEQTLEKMVIREEEIRMSQSYQDKCTEVKDIPNGWLQVTEKMQEDLVTSFGFTDNLSCSVACNKLRTARYIYPDNKIFTQVPVYVRENKANVGHLVNGDKAPNIQVHTVNNEKIMLHDLLKTDKVNMIFGASHT
jgi:hypothetical protein